MSKAGFKVLERPPIEESYSYSEQVRRQIERYLEASAIQDIEIREGTYKACVLALADLVPFDDRGKKFISALDACSVDEEYYQYVKFGGVNMGTPEEPVCGSPSLENRKVTNWNMFFQVLFNKFVELGVTVRRGDHSG